MSLFYFVSVICTFFIYNINSCNTSLSPTKKNSFRDDCTPWQISQAQHNPTYLLDRPNIIQHLVENLQDEEDFENHLENILKVRTVDSSGLAQVRNYIVDTLTNLGWSIEEDTFEQDTVIGPKNFTNIITTWNPDSPRRLVLACHSDSKSRPAGFVGAIDSAVPCAMLINAARTLQRVIEQTNEANAELTVTLIFFDGEEAFKHWTSTDSLYGSRHLSAAWAAEQFEAQPPFCQATGKRPNWIDRMDLFILLDLLGTSKPRFQKYSEYDGRSYDSMMSIESTLRKTYPSEQPQMFTGTLGWPIDDDHQPFADRGFSRILHMIASPFPSVWHTINDNYQALDLQTIARINMMIRVFVAQYLQYDG